MKNNNSTSKLITQDSLWATIISECVGCVKEEKLLHQFLQNAVLKQESFESALAWILAEQLKSNIVSMDALRLIIGETLCADDIIKRQIRMDLVAYIERDPACKKYHLPLLYFKGFHALQVYRVTHSLWKKIEKI